MPSKHVRTGDIVMSADGKDLGTVKQVGDTCFRIAAKHRRDYWLSNDAVEGRDQGIAVLLFDHNKLGDAFVDVTTHTGQHSHPKQPSTGGQGLAKPLLMLAGMGAMAMRDKERREKAIELSKKAVEEVRARIAKKQDEAKSEWQTPPATSGYSATSTFVPPVPTPAATSVSSPPPAPPPPPPASFYTPPAAARPIAPAVVSDADLKARERAVVTEVTKAFPAMNLQVAPIEVHTLEGKSVQTLRFTLDETASSDVQLDTLARPAASEEAIAAEIIRDLRLQLPPAPANQT